MVSQPKKVNILLSLIFTFVGCSVPKHNTANTKPEASVAQCVEIPETSQIPTNRKLSHLNKSELKRFINSMNNYIKAKYELTKNRSPKTEQNQKSAKIELEKLASRLNLARINKGDLKKEFEKAGYVFDVHRCFLNGFRNANSYTFGKIIKSEDCDCGKDVKIIYHSSKGFAQSLEYEINKSPMPLFYKGNRIYVNNHMVNIELKRIYRSCDIYDEAGESKQAQLSPGKRFLFLDYLEYKKGNPNLSEDEFANRYGPELIRSCLEHEKSHIRRKIKEERESETVAFLEQLKTAPIYYAFAMLELNSNLHIYSEAKRNIFNWFEEKGYNRKKLYRTPLKEISTVAGEIMREKYPNLN